MPAHPQPLFNASVVAELNTREIDQTGAICKALADVEAATVMPEQFIFFAAFDGTNNNATDLGLSGTPQQTNVAQLFEQVNDQRAAHARLTTAYYPGVGTGGEAGGFDARSSVPTPYIAATAEKAYGDFAREAEAWLAVPRPPLREDLTVVLTGFSRGAATAVAFARLLNDRGLVSGGRLLIPPGLVRVSAMLLFDPVFTRVEMDLNLPANVIGQVCVIRARHEYRYLFRAADYSADARVRTVIVPGNHGNVGGMYDNGIGAMVLEGACGFFRACGLPISDVPQSRRFDRTQPVRIYSEGVDRFGNRIWSESGSRGAIRLTSGLDNRPRH
jgi:pimeloyl-ACP methyl ester carboxylesterase